MPNPRTPKIKILELRDDYARFELSRTDCSMANALRRIMIAEVPTMAIDLVEVLENSTSLADDMIAQRLGLIPIKVHEDINNFVYNKDCNCGGYCDKCSLAFTLDVDFENPMETRHDYERDQPFAITSQHLRNELKRAEPAHHSGEFEETASANIGIPIVVIGKGQKLHCRCFATKGIAKEHAKWSPVSITTFIAIPSIRIDYGILERVLTTPELMQGFVASCPVGVYIYDQTAERVVLANERDCMFCKECINYVSDLEVLVASPPVEISSSGDSFIFTLETVGSLTAEQVIVSALDVLGEKLRALSSFIASIHT